MLLSGIVVRSVNIEWRRDEKATRNWKMRHWLLHRLRNWRTIYFIVAKLPMLASTEHKKCANCKKKKKTIQTHSGCNGEMEKTIRLFNVVQLSICLDCILWHGFLFCSSLSLSSLARSHLTQTSYVLLCCHSSHQTEPMAHLFRCCHFAAVSQIICFIVSISSARNGCLAQ